jgi:limonene-1,2-epoxide hydrolase
VTADELAAEQVVRDFCAAVEAKDVEQLRPFFTDDVVYHNIPMEPARGIAATIDALAGMFSMFATVEFELTHLAVTGNVVLTERIDRVTLGPTVAPMPVMGAFEVVGGRIAAWRDYFDMNQVGQMVAGGPGG